MWIALAILFVLLLGSGGAAYFFVSPHQNQTSPTVTLQHFCDGWKKSDAQEMYDTFSNSLKNTMGSVSKMQTDLNQQKDGDCTIVSVQVNGSQATAILSTVYTDSAIDNQWMTLKESVSLIQEDGQWKINNITQ